MVMTAETDLVASTAIARGASQPRRPAVLEGAAACRAFDQRLTVLLSQYTLAIEQSRQLPLISLAGFVAYWLKSMRWVLALYAIVPALVWDFSLRLLLNCFRSKALVPLHKRLLQWLLAPFQAVYSGEMSAFKFLTIRPVARLLLYYRLSRRVQCLVGFLRQRRVDLFVHTQGGGDAQWFSDRVAVLNDCRDGFGKRLGYAAVASTLGSLGFVSALYKLAKHAVPQLEELATNLLSRLSFSKDGMEGLAALAASYLVWTIVTNWIEVRQVVNDMALLPTEQALFNSIELQRPEDVDIDLIGLFLMGLSFLIAPQLIAASTDWADLASSSLLLAVPALALYRRVKLRAAAARQPLEV